MLYITTRENKDAYTAARTLAQDKAADGGVYVPFRLPEYTKEEILSLKLKTFGQAVADVLNVFFASRTTGWDVDLCIGKNPVKLLSMNHKISVAELWHNPEREYSYIVKKLYERILRPQNSNRDPSQWAQIAVRIAVLFGVFGELLRSEITDGVQPVDLAVPAKDFSVPMACWYARKMGLPIGVIVCGCDMNSGLWDLIRRGEFSTASPSCDAQQERAGLERLIQGTLGCDEVNRYLECCQNRRTYTVVDEAFSELRNGLFTAVVGKNRVDLIMSSLNKTGAHVFDFDVALSYGALQDYRAGNSEGRTALLLSDGV